MEILSLPEGTGNVRSVAFSPDGQRAVTGNTDGRTVVWDAVTGREILTLDKQSDTIHRVLISQAVIPDIGRPTKYSWPTCREQNRYQALGILCTSRLLSCQGDSASEKTRRKGVSVPTAKAGGMDSTASL